MLVAHNYDTYKVENREKEREEIARKAAKMADDVLLREPDRESHPISVLTTITLLSENRYLIQQLEMRPDFKRRASVRVSLLVCWLCRFMTPEELDTLSAYLKDKRARLLRSTADPLAGTSIHPILCVEQLQILQSAQTQIVLNNRFQ